MRIVFLQVLFVLSFPLWAIGGRPIKDIAHDLQAYTCKLDLESELISDGKPNGKMTAPCSSVVIEKKANELKVLTAAHCLINFDMNSSRDKVYYHYSEPKALKCIERVQGAKVYYADYKVSDYSFIYDKRFILNKAMTVIIENYSDEEKTEKVSLSRLDSSDGQSLKSIPVNDDSYGQFLAKSVSLDLVVLTINLDKIPNLTGLASIPEDLSLAKKFSKCNIAGYSKKNNRLSVGEVSDINLNNDPMDKKGYLNTFKTGQKNWIEPGDSGGPLYCEHGNSWSVVGIASNSDSILSMPTLYWSLVDRKILNNMLSSDNSEIIELKKTK